MAELYSKVVYFKTEAERDAFIPPAPAEAPVVEKPLRIPRKK